MSLSIGRRMREGRREWPLLCIDWMGQKVKIAEKIL